MDAETLRTVLEAQTKAPQQMFTEMMKRMERMASASSPAVPTTGSMGSASITPSTFTTISGIWVNVVKSAFVQLKDRRGHKLKSAHALTETAKNYHEDAFYDEFNALTSKTRSQQTVIVGIDANTKIHHEQQSYVIGKWLSAHVARDNPFNARRAAPVENGNSLTTTRLRLDKEIFSVEYPKFEEFNINRRSIWQGKNRKTTTIAQAPAGLNSPFELEIGVRQAAVAVLFNFAVADIMRRTVEPMSLMSLLRRLDVPWTS
ncbi:hypothetical protein RB195_010594 [Necator americanus]|uniref:Uncharacterized protein n=1 Tax=Necator americanus TaxID=51031 RepID=A0ABR1D016_NECAM